MSNEVELSHILISDRQFSNTGVSLDNAQFSKCEFRNCELIYSGGPFLMDACWIENCRWKIQAGAALTLDSLTKAGWQILPPMSGKPDA